MSLCSNHKHMFITGDIYAGTARLRDFTRLDPFVVDMFDIDKVSLIKQPFQRTSASFLTECLMTIKLIFLDTG